MVHGKAKLAIFDWDSTTADPGLTDQRHGLTDEMQEALILLQERGYKTTINTTRDPVELLDVLGSRRETLLSPDVAIGVENGGRIGRFENVSDELDFRTLQVTSLQDIEIELIIELLHKSHDIGIKFYSGNLGQGQIVWAKNSSVLREMKKVFILCKDFTVGDTTDAERLLLEYKPAYISIFGEIEPPRKLHFFVAGKERNVTSQRVDKGTSLSFIVEFENADVEQCIVAGDSTPDIPMLTFEGIGKRIQVKRQGLVENDDTTEYVENARELGKYILHFIKDNKL